MPEIDNSARSTQRELVNKASSLSNEAPDISELPGSLHGRQPGPTHTGDATYDGVQDNSCEGNSDCGSSEIHQAKEATKVKDESRITSFNVAVRDVLVSREEQMTSYLCMLTHWLEPELVGNQIVPARASGLDPDRQEFLRELKRFHRKTWEEFQAAYRQLYDKKGWTDVDTFASFPGNEAAKVRQWMIQEINSGRLEGWNGNDLAPYVQSRRKLRSRLRSRSGMGSAS